MNWHLDLNTILIAMIGSGGSIASYLASRQRKEIATKTEAIHERVNGSLTAQLDTLVTTEEAREVAALVANRTTQAAAVVAEKAAEVADAIIQKIDEKVTPPGL